MSEDNIVDLTGHFLLIATPSMTGKPEGEFVRCRQQTIEIIRQHGGEAGYIEDRYCADIYLSRSKLFESFLQHPKATTMIMIDDDMDWNPVDVVHMILLNRDFIGAAGPRKKYPIDFAFQLCDDYSNPVALYHEIETNVAEVSALGGAFVMITRKCAQRLWDAHPELEFDRTETDVARAVFDPIIINKGPEYPRRRLAEDYALCYRWRQLGGKVYCYLPVKLGHTGVHRFEGSLLEHLAKHDPDFNNG